MRSIGGGFGGRPSKEPTERKLFRRKTVNTTAPENRFDIETIGAFKLIPSFTPSHFNTNRPLMGKGCNCMPLSAGDPRSNSFKELGMRNLFDVRNELSSIGAFSQIFPLEAYTFQRPLFESYPDVTSSVLASPRVLTALQITAEQVISGSGVNNIDGSISRQLKVLKKESARILKSMKASVSPLFISMTAWFLTRFLSHFIQSVQVCRGQMMMIKKAQEKQVPMIYLPLHRSHLDYILVTLILWHYDVRAPHVAAGDNMDIPVFNLLMRALGGFFIRRKLDPKRGVKDVLYRSILNEYMSFLLKNGEGLEFFIEGGRTRSGRSLDPKGGLLSVVVESCSRGDIPDALIVPVAFSYEKIIDGDFSREQMGQPKVKESFWGAVRAILRVIFNNYGSVRVDFSQPFSLQEFLKGPSVSGNYNPLTFTNSLTSKQSLPNFSVSLVENEDNVRMSVKALADHIVYSNDRCTPPMSTHLTAFLLLTKYRNGGYMKELVQAVHWIVRELQGIGVDVGFCGKPEDAISHAQKLLGKHLLVREWIAVNNDVRLVPNLTLPNVFELSYYGNAVSTHFALESVMAISVIFESGVSNYQLSSFESNSMKQIKVSRDKVLDIAEKLCTLLHNEFIFVPPCVNINTALMEMLESMISKEVLFVEDQNNEQMMFEGKDRRWADRMAAALDPDEEEYQGQYRAEQSLGVNIQRSDIRERLQFLTAVAGPLLESYLIVGKFALDNLSQEQVEVDFYKALGKYARNRVSEDLSVYSESCAMATLKSAVKSFRNLNIIYSYKAANIQLLGLNKDGNSSLQNYISILETCLS